MIEQFSIFGVKVANLNKQTAIELLEDLVRSQQEDAKSIFIVNAHTLNLARKDKNYHRILNNAYKVLGDGTGVRWAARNRGVTVKANLVGTDLVPEFFAATAGQNYRYFLLGADADTIKQTAEYCAKTFFILGAVLPFPNVD